MRRSISRPISAFPGYYRAQLNTHPPYWSNARHASSSSTSSPGKPPVRKPTTARKQPELVYQRAPPRPSTGPTPTTPDPATDSTSAPTPSTPTSSTPPTPMTPVKPTTTTATTTAAKDPLSPQDPRDQEESAAEAVKEGHFPSNYKSAERRVKMIIVAMPILLVTSWVLYGRCEFQNPLPPLHPVPLLFLRENKT